MEICDKYLEDAQRALKSSMLSKPDPMEAVRCYEGAAICFENFKNFQKAALCYAETANLISRIDPLKAAEMHQRAASCFEKSGGPSSEHYLQAATIFKNHAVHKYRENPEQGMQLLQKAAEDFEKGGDRDMAVQCYEVGAEASFQRKDFLNAIVFYGAAGQSFERRKEYRKAVNYFHKVAKLWDSQNVPGNVAENYLRMATSLDTLKEYEYSTQFFIKAAEKYEQAQETYKSAKAYEKAGETLGMQEKFLEAAKVFEKSAEQVKSLKNMDKFEELYTKAADSHVKAGETQKAVEMYVMLAETFSEDPYRCNKHFEQAISFAESNPSLKAELLRKQGDALMQVHDYLKAGSSLEEAAELYRNKGEPPSTFSEIYKKAGDAYSLFAKGMERVKNELKAREGFEKAVACYEKAGAREEIEKISQRAKPGMSERERQIREELNRLQVDFEKGLLPELVLKQIKEGYQELLKHLRQ